MARKSKSSSEEGGCLGIVILGGVLLYMAKPDLSKFGITERDMPLVVGVAVVGLLVLVGIVILMVRAINRREEETERRRLEQEQRDAQRAHLNRSLMRTMQLSPSEFEQEVAWLFNVFTPYFARRVGRGGDRGVDIELRDKESNELLGVVQCKRYDPTTALPPDVLRSLRTTMHDHNVLVGYLVTTARFSKQSVELAKKYGIRLLDGQRLEEMRDKAYAQVGGQEVRPTRLATLPTVPAAPLVPKPAPSASAKAVSAAAMNEVEKQLAERRARLSLRQ